MTLPLSRQQLIAYSAIGLLAVVLAGILVYSQLIVESGDVTAGRKDVATVGGLRADEASQRFDVSVLQDPAYTTLNRALLDAGRLPVPVPATRGKPNLFGL